jgi:hypothetical protein
MSEDGSPSTDLVGAFAKELAEKFPVKEALTPAAVQTGLILSDAAKTIHLALFPLQFLGAYQDRLRHFIDTAVRRVPEEKRIPPAPQILGPIIEGLRYEPEGTPIEAMYSELLSRSIDEDRVEEAHPAYPLIIRQLSADEVKILDRLNGKTYERVHTQEYFAETNLFSNKQTVESDALPREELAFPNNVDFYFAHLHQLGLAAMYQDGNQEILHGDDPRIQTGVRVKTRYTLTDFGQRFVKACIGPSVPFG